MASPDIRVRLLPSACGPERALQYANTFVLNDTIAIDAGSLGFNGSPATQSRVRDILLTHCHADHYRNCDRNNRAERIPHISSCKPASAPEEAGVR